MGFWFQLLFYKEMKKTETKTKFFGFGQMMENFKQNNR